ncbi:MAG: DUF1302 domain-containing protein [Steroidobacteraceae bacterium]
MRIKSTNRKAWRRAAGLGVLGWLVSVADSAGAFEMDTGNPDLVVRWDNTVRYNLGVRAQSQDPAILGSPNADDGDRNFSNGSLVTNRFDVLSEFDIVWRKSFGARVSAAGWYDFAYQHLDDTSTASANTLVDGLPVAGQLSPYTKRYAKGASGEWLDAFMFVNFNVGNTPVNVKVGQHTVYWGESLLLGGLVHGIAYSQNSVDQWKGVANPGSEAKELFRPRGGITVQAQPTSELSLAAQWFYNWQAVRAPESGTYLSGTDMLNFGGDSLIVGPNQRLWNTQAVEPSRYSSSIGDFGLAARWSPEWLDGTIGFYYRDTTDILPQVMVTPGVAQVPSPQVCQALGGQPLAPTSPTPCLVNPDATTIADLQKYGKAGTYQTAYARDIHLYGLSLAKNIAGVSLGAEVSYRENMPLVSDPAPVLPAPLAAVTPGAIATTAVPADGDTAGTRGTTWHGLVNGLVVIPESRLFDTASLLAEVSWMHLESVTQNEALYKGRSDYSGSDKPTDTYVGLAVNFTPQWFQVFPSVDLTMPITWSQGLSGTAATLFGGDEGSGSWSIGVGATIVQKYLVNLSYIGYYGDNSVNAAGMRTFAGPNAANADRGWVSLNFKTTF